MKFIKSFEYDQSYFNDIGEYKYGKNRPVVYVIEGGKEAYIGETSDVYNRSHQHYKKLDRNKLNSIHIIGDDEFNKSATLDIEALLIEFMSADGKYLLQNGNGGLKNHRYFNKHLYHDVKFEMIWKELREKGLAIKELIQIRNSDLLKFSPYKALTEDQLQIAKSVTTSILTTDKSKHMIKGEPGSGKTILAVFLVKYLRQMNKLEKLNIGLVIPMTSLRKTLKSVFKNVKGLSASMVIGPNEVVKKDYDILIIDEAHRLNRRIGLTSYGSYDEVNRKLGLDKYTGTQLDWIEMTCKHAVYLYDGNQSVKPTDIEESRFREIDATIYELKSQMRVQGGHDYIAYIDNILNQKQVNKMKFDKYEFLLFDNVNDMVEIIKIKDKAFKLSRVVAGFAWDWISKNDKSLKDIQIGRNAYMWNSTNQDWVNSPNALNEVGCIHSIQGYDLNYTGVIIGPEIVMRDNKILVDKDKYKDKKGKFALNDPEQLKIYIKNIYKVLLTRGIKGTYVYVCDEALRDYFKQFIVTFNDKNDYRFMQGDVSIVAEKI